MWIHLQLIGGKDNYPCPAAYLMVHNDSDFIKYTNYSKKLSVDSHTCILSEDPSGNISTCYYSPVKDACWDLYEIGHWK